MFLVKYQMKIFNKPGKYALFILYKLFYWSNYSLYNRIFLQFIMRKDKTFIDSRRDLNSGAFNNYSKVPNVSTNRSQNILFNVHWFNLGGAESYALYLMRVAKSLGHQIFIIAGREGCIDDISKFSELANDIVEYHKIGCKRQYPTFLLNYIAAKKIDIIHIHHCGLTYMALPQVKNNFPQIKVIDSLHIIEYTTSYYRVTGGFVRLAVKYYKYIDLHNVISNNLRTYLLRKINEIDSLSKPNIMTRYLSSLSVANPVATHKNFATKTIPLLFYARFENQKQPNLFIEIVKFLNKKSSGFKFIGIMVGSGKFEQKMRRLAEHSDCLEIRARNDNSSEVFMAAPILLITSINEGLTLTAFEAIKNKTLVISTDVGAQSELIPKALLVNILDRNIVNSFANIILQCVSDKEFFNSSLVEECNNLKLLEDISLTLNDIKNMYSV